MCRIFRFVFYGWLIKHLTFENTSTYHREIDHLQAMAKNCSGQWLDVSMIDFPLLVRDSWWTDRLFFMSKIRGLTGTILSSINSKIWIKSGAQASQRVSFFEFYSKLCIFPKYTLTERCKRTSDRITIFWLKKSMFHKNKKRKNVFSKFFFYFLRKYRYNFIN